MALLPLLPFLSPQHRALAIAFGLTLCDVLVELSYPLFMALLIDRGILGQNLSKCCSGAP